VAAVAEPEVDEAVLEAVDEPPTADEELEAPAPTALAFRLPQTNDWQKVWPARSFGWAAVHWPTHDSHSSDGSVSPYAEMFGVVPVRHVQLYSSVVCTVLASIASARKFRTACAGTYGVAGVVSCLAILTQQRASVRLRSTP